MIQAMFDHIWSPRVSLILAIFGFLALQVHADKDVVANLLLSPALDMIDASWELVNSTGDVYLYSVSWAEPEGSTLTCYVDSPSTNTSACDVRPTLASCSHYTVTVQPQKLLFPSIADTGTPASAAAYTLAGDFTISNAECVAHYDLSITVTWGGPGECVEYDVSYTGTVLWGDHGSPHDSLTTRDLTATFYNLLPYTSYFVAVSAGEADGEASCNATTPEKVPTQPTNLDITPLNISTVSVSWEPPEQENGIITSYTVSWRLANETTEEGAVRLPGDQLSYDVPDLLECLLYAFSVTASTSVGEGPEAGTESVAGGDVGAPEVSCSKTEKYVQVSWVAPEVDSGCNITNYYVNMTIIVLWSEEQHSTEPESVGLAPPYRDENPEPYSEYTFDVRASLGGSVLGPAGTCSVTTDEAAPSAPQNLTLLSATTSTLSIQWQQPAELNGVLRSYIVSWGVSGSEDPMENATVDAQKECCVYNYTISGLAAGKTYATAVQGVTTEAGDAAEDEYSTKDTPSESPVAGIVVGCIFGILLLVAIAVAFIKRDYIKERFSAMNRPPSNAHTSKSAEASVSNSSSQEMLNTTDQTFPNVELRAKTVVSSTSEAGSQHEVSGNQYSNIAFAGKTRRQLRSDWSSIDDINASYVKDWSGNIKFIAFQGPKEETVDDFWSMIWQENVRVIVMLANCQEGGKQICARYWPAQRQTPVLVDQKYLRLEEEYQQAAYIRRRLSLGAENAQSSREITQFHFTNWPDFGVPSSEHVLLSFLCHVRAETSPGETVAVHCSAGVGRTCTFIALWNLQESNEHKAVINIDDAILKIRKDRKDMIQSTEQYLYVHKCLVKYLQSHGIYAVGGASHRGYHDAGNLKEDQVYSNLNTAASRPVFDGYMNPIENSANPSAIAATPIQYSRVTPHPPTAPRPRTAPHPPTAPPPPPRSAPPPLPPPRNEDSRHS